MIKERENNMQLLKEKLKTKKYQYKYLWHKVCEQSESINRYQDVYNEPCQIESERIQFYFNWLDKINKKYNYA